MTPPLKRVGAPSARPDTALYFLEIARAVAARGTCSRRKVGAVAVRHGRILSTGYNGAPEKSRHCEHEAYPDGVGDPDLHLVNGRMSCSRAIHAEANVIAYAARYGVALIGATIYCDTYPCYGCAKTMVSAGVYSVVFGADYTNDPLVEQLCQESQLVVVRGV